MYQTVEVDKNCNFNIAVTKFAKLFVFIQFVVFATDAHDAKIASINTEKNI